MWPARHHRAPHPHARRPALTRLCPHAPDYPAERLEHFLDTLRHGVQSRGVPDKLCTDNGGLFASLHLQTICARPGIQLLHHKPYQAWSKDKMERFCHTVQTDFQQRLVFAPVDSLAELNRRIWQWLENEDHRRLPRAWRTPGRRRALPSVVRGCACWLNWYWTGRN